jgi:hypothetical protein
LTMNTVQAIQDDEAATSRFLSGREEPLFRMAVQK